MLSTYLNWFSDLSCEIKDHEDDRLLHEARPKEGLLLSSQQLEINGVTLPDEVIRQLRSMLTTPLCWLSQNELQEAVNGYRGDGNVFDDPDGCSILDMIQKTREEQDDDNNIENFYERYQRVRVRPLTLSQQTCEDRIQREYYDNTPPKQALS